MESGKLAPGGVVTEGSAGSTAISLATVAPAFGCKCHVVIPDDVAIEKVRDNVFKMRTVMFKRKIGFMTTIILFACL